MFIEIDVESIVPNPFQPRTLMDSDKLNEISESIKQVGIIQPLVVREINGNYQLVAGERRLRGAIKAGMTKVPVIVKNVNDEEMLQLALIENLHREDLSPIDKALGFKDLIEKFNLTQKRISEVFNLSRPAVANTIRLLDLDEDIKFALHNKQITEGHARALLAIKEKHKRQIALSRVISKGLSVRESEELSRKLNKVSQMTFEMQQKNRLSIFEQRLVDELRMKLGTKVSIDKENGIGKIEIEFYSEEDLERLMDALLLQK